MAQPAVQRQTRRHRLRVCFNGGYWIRTPRRTPGDSMEEGESGAESGAMAGEDASVRAGRGLGGTGGSRPGEGHVGQCGGLPGRVARGQRTGALGDHGSSRTRTHALGPTERLAGTIKFISGRCHRYRNSTGTASARGRIPQEVVHLRSQRAAIPAFPNTIVRGVAAEWAGQSGRPFADGAPVRMNATM